MKHETHVSLTRLLLLRSVMYAKVLTGRPGEARGNGSITESAHEAPRSLGWLEGLKATL